MSEAQQIERIRTASRRLVRAFGFLDRTIAGTDLSATAVHAIVEIGRASKSNSGEMTARELAVLLGLEKSTVSRLVAGLVRRGELAEEKSPADGREKLLALTDKGKITLAAIDRHANDQVALALDGLAVPLRDTVRAGLELYAEALAGEAVQTGSAGRSEPALRTGYTPGIIASVTGMHANYYSRETGFGEAFEAIVASGLAEFVPRAGREQNRIWRAEDRGRIVGSITIDGEDLNRESGDTKLAHLRWFVVDDGYRGTGLGRALLSAALAFCDENDFDETHLWTFHGLDAARRLYEANGFVLAEEQPGDQWGRQVMEQKFIRPHPSRQLS